MRRAVIVLTENRTASQSVYAALKPFEAAPDIIVRHAHDLDGRPWRGVPRDPEKAARLATKARKEAEVREILADQEIDRTIVTIYRDPLDRLISDLWYSRHREISLCYLGNGFMPLLHDVVRKPTCWIVDKALCRTHEVWKPLGMPCMGPQAHAEYFGQRLRRYTLRFSHIDGDFDRFLGIVGRLKILPVSAMDLGSLPHKNSGDSFGDPAIYKAFREWGLAHLSATPAVFDSPRVVNFRSADRLVDFVSLG